MTALPRTLVPRPPGRRQWSGLSGFCPLCGRTMDMVLDDGRECYECPDCLHEFGERQLELFTGAVA